jgi:hypothetical protein
MEKMEAQERKGEYKQVRIEKNVYDALERRIKKISEDSQLSKPFTIEEIVNSLLKSALVEDTSVI